MSRPRESEENPLIRLAESISDGAEVDWEGELAKGIAPEQTLRRLQLVQTIVKAQRDLRDSPESGYRPALPDGASWGRLRNLKLMRRGSYGEVYRAFDPVLEREVALKLPRMDRGGRERSRDQLTEARLLARVDHPNVLSVHGADEIDGRLGFWTDIVEGRTLEECLEEQGPFSAREAAGIGIDLCGALAAVHSKGLVHRDVKTSNVMRGERGRIVLMDFGTASAKERANGSHEMNGRAGTLIAMAPEVLMDGEPAGPQADLYGLGVILYRLVSGRFPIEARTLHDLMAAHRDGTRVPLRDVCPDLPAPYVRVVERALSARPAERFASAGEMEKELAAALAAEGGHPAPAKRPRFSWRAVAAAAVVVLSLIGAAWYLWPRPLQVEARFFRVAGDQFEPMVSGARVQPGDHLGLEIYGSEPVYSYVLNEDAKGELWVLFPAGLDLANPIPPRKRIRLPGRLAGETVDWIVTTANGSETILAILSRKPLTDLERLLAELPRVGSGGGPSYRSIPAESRALLFRGIHELAPSPAQGTLGAPTRLADLVQTLPSEASLSKGVWIRKLELENPGP